MGEESEYTFQQRYVQDRMFIYLSVSLHHHLSVQDGQEAHGRTLKTLCCVREPSGRWPHVVRFHLSEMSRIGKSVVSRSWGIA